MSKNIKIKELKPIFPAVEHKSFRDMLKYAAKSFKDDNAFIIKTQKEKKNVPAAYRYVTYEEFFEEIEALGTAMMSLGLKDKHIALIGDNSYHWALTYFTVVSDLGTLVPLDKGLPYAELKNSIERSYSDVLIFDKAHQDLAERLQEEGADIKTYICLDDVVGYISLNNLIENGKKLIAEGNRDYIDVPQDTEKMQLLIFTSGTTSKAKAVMLNQRNIMKNIYAMQLVEDVQHGDVNMAFLPYHHTFGSTGQVIMIAAGATTVYCDGLKYVQKNLQEYHVSVFVGVPLIVEALYKRVMTAVRKQGKEAKLMKGIKISNFLRHIGIDRRRKMFSEVLTPLGGALRLIFSGASALDPEVAVNLEAMGITVAQGYGMTESSPVIAAENIKNLCPGTIGLAMPGTELEINEPDENGVGELIAKSGSVMMGYFENEEATNETLKDGWLHTGDLAYVDKSGYIHICGRSKNMIVLKNGKKVFPEEVEELIDALPYVKESMVYAEPRRAGDDQDLVLIARIVYDAEYLRDFYQASDLEKIEEIVSVDMDKINAKMPKYKSIYRWTVQETEMVKTTTGKIKRFQEIAKKTEA